MNISLSVIQKNMIKNFQCDGCVCGSDPDECSAFKPNKHCGAFFCESWIPGTICAPSPGLICLGLPKGFNIIGEHITGEAIRKFGYIFLHESPDDILKNPISATNIFSGYWNKLNIPVWAMEHKGYLFVKTYSPRKNRMWVSVIKGATMSLFDSYPDVPRPINVAEFVDQIS